MDSLWTSKSWVSLLLLLLAIPVPLISAGIIVSAPTPPQGGNVVFPNFFGISIELSFLNQYFGNDTSSIPAPILSYLSTFKSMSSGLPLRIRIGGNSMDSSTFFPNQTQMMVFPNISANSNNQPVNFGPTVFDVLNKVGQDVGGIQYLIGLSLMRPNDTTIPQMAVSAQQILGANLDSFLLGNEPDSYFSHGNRPGLANYTVSNYVADYSTVLNALGNTASGNLTALDKISGPTICCIWDLATTMQQWLPTFGKEIKYITVQHYPQNNCGLGGPLPRLSYYLDHVNVVGLARWQSSGVTLAHQQGKNMVMSEFNSASCGGIPGISDTFGATLWAADYVFQLAASGYNVVHMHTRERGTTYNLFDYPNGDGKWTTNPSYYTYLPVLQSLQSVNGSRVVDLNINNSMTASSTSAGYGVYDASTNELYRVVLLNYANGTGPGGFSLPKAMFPVTGNNITIKYLTAPTVNDKTNISWSGMTWNGVTDGKAVSAGGNGDMSLDCVQGCTVSIPSPGLAVLVVNRQSPGGRVIGSNGTPPSKVAHKVVIPSLLFAFVAIISGL